MLIFNMADAYPPLSKYKMYETNFGTYSLVNLLSVLFIYLFNVN